MRCIHHTAFWFATIASSLFGFATFLPLWLGRIAGSSTRFYALWYQLLCSQNSCTGFEMMFENDNVEGTYDFELISLPMCALLAAISSFIGVLLIEILSCDCGRRWDCNTRPVVVFCTIMFLIASIFSVLAFFISVAVATEFYKANKIDHASEFPWCTLFFAIGAILIVIATIMYVFILCQWEKHGMFYGPGGDYWGPMDYAESMSTSGTYVKSPSFRESTKYGDDKSRVSDLKSSYSESIKRSFRDTSRMPVRESTKVPSLGGMGGFVNHGMDRSEYGKGRESTYFDFRLGSSMKKSNLFGKKSSSVSDLRQSRKNIYDSPSILRHTKANEFIREERDSIRESRKIPKSTGFEEIDPKRLTTGNTRYREDRVNRYGEHSPMVHREKKSHSDFSGMESRKIPRNRSFEDIDPHHLSVGNTSYREDRLGRHGNRDSDYMSGSTHSSSSSSDLHRKESNILDVLYRESRKYKD